MTGALTCIARRWTILCKLSGSRLLHRSSPKWQNIRFDNDWKWFQIQTW